MGDRRQLAKAITQAESSHSTDRHASNVLLDALLPATGGAIRIGVSGLPGVGKSTFIETLGKYLCGRGHQLAVLSIDPSSSINGGSILGDKTRMPELSVHPNAYIRPSPSGNSFGGVASATRESILLCEAAGFDVVLVETVGVGQLETAVADMTDIFLLLLLPSAGDQLQGIKRGIIEHADIVLINKADGDLLGAAQRTVADYRAALTLLRRSVPGAGGVPVLPVSAFANTGIQEAWEGIQSLWHDLRETDALERNRRQQRVHWMRENLYASIKKQILTDFDANHSLQTLEAQVSSATLSSGSAVQAILQSLSTSERDVRSKKNDR